MFLDFGEDSKNEIEVKIADKTECKDKERLTVGATDAVDRSDTLLRDKMEATNIRTIKYDTDKGVQAGQRRYLTQTEVSTR